jgi:endoglucanase
MVRFGGNNNTQCYQELGQLLDYMAQNEEYVGWTAWAAGPLWGQSSPCCTDGAREASLEPGVPAAGGGPP